MVGIQSVNWCLWLL